MDMKPRRLLRRTVLLIGLVWLAANVVAPRHIAVSLDEERGINESVSAYRERLTDTYNAQLRALEAENADLVVGGPPAWLTVLAATGLIAYAVDWLARAPAAPNRRSRPTD